MITVPPFFDEAKHGMNLRKGKPGGEMGSYFIETYCTLQTHVFSTRHAGFENMQVIQK